MFRTTSASKGDRLDAAKHVKAPGNLLLTVTWRYFFVVPQCFVLLCPRVYGHLNNSCPYCFLSCCAFKCKIKNVKITVTAVFSKGF